MLKKMSLILIFALSACVPKQPTLRQPYSSRTPSSGIYHVVKKGDSLWAISKKYGVSLKKLARRNRISEPDNLKVGQKIFIPRYRIMTTSSFSWPIQGEVINGFGENINNYTNKGINIKAGPNNKLVKAAAQGKIVFSNDLKGWGKTIVMQHSSNFYTIYANLDNVKVSNGSIAEEGQSIGEIVSGKNGNYILHFEIRKKYVPQNPLKYLN